MNREKRSKHSKVLGVYFTYVGAKTPGRIDHTFFLVVDVCGLITCFKFGDDRFRGLASAEGQILPFPIDFDGRPYNTLTIPCERVIYLILLFAIRLERSARGVKIGKNIQARTLCIIVCPMQYIAWDKIYKNQTVSWIADRTASQLDYR